MSAVDEIKSRLDIVDIISDSVPLQKSGRNYKGICPFHSEKTPSFVVFPENQSWYCFGACKVGGDIFSFVMKRENLDFAEALQLLARKAGVQLEPPRQQDAERQKHLDKLSDILGAATAYYSRLLHSSPGKAAYEYVTARGLSGDTIQKFQLGFALDDWRALSDHLLKRGYERQELLEAGLIVARDDGGHYDRFRGRLMIPIRNVNGHVIGFGGRVLTKEQPKYLNSPQTPLFDKSGILFGLDLAKPAIRAKGYVAIAEGYMDVLQAHQAGFGNVVASMGTALTEEQLGLLKRITKRYILALDPDLAGNQATLRGLAVARQALDRQTVPVPTARGWIRYESRLDADIRIMTLPPGQDPDDLIREDPSQWETLVDAAVPVVDYYFTVAAKDLDVGSSAKDKAEFVRRLVPVLSEIRDEVERTHYIQKLARLVRVDEQTLRRQLGKSKGQPARQRTMAEAETAEEPNSAVFALEEYCLSVLLRRPDFLERVDKVLRDTGLAPLRAEDFELTENRNLFDAWRQVEAEQEWQEWTELLSSTLNDHLEFLLARGPDTDELVGAEAERDIERRILALRRRNVERVSRSLQMLQMEALEQGEPKATEYGQAMVGLTMERLRLEHALAERTALGKHEQKEREI